MNCTEFERGLQTAVEQRRLGELSPFRAHVGECTACSEKWEDYKLLARAVAAWKSDLPEVDLTDAVLDGLDRTLVRPANEVHGVNSPRGGRSPANASRNSRLAITVVAAAVLLLAMILMHGQDAPVAAVAENDEKPSQPELIVVEQRDEPELDLLLRDAGSAYLDLARGAADALTEVSVLVPTGTYAGRESGTTCPAGGRTWIDRWQDGLRPIGQDFERAVDFLLDVVPTEPAPTT